MNSKLLTAFIFLIIVVLIGLLYWSSKKDNIKNQKIVQAPEVDAFVSRGWSKQTNGDYVGAIEEYSQAIERAIQLGTITPTLYSFRADVKQSLGDYKGAVEDYTYAIELEPDLVSYMERADAREFISDYKGALEDVTKAISLSEGNASTLASLYSYRAKIKRKLGDEAGAKADKEKESEIMKKNGIGWE